jgi:hypothetical protein
MTEANKRAPRLVAYPPINPRHRQPERVTFVRKGDSALRIGDLLGYAVNKNALELVWHALGLKFAHHEVGVQFDHRINNEVPDLLRHRVALE